MNIFKKNPRPEEFPIGSAESRAAARALLEARVEVTITVRNFFSGRQEGDPPLPPPKYDGGVIEIVYPGWDKTDNYEQAPTSYPDFSSSEAPAIPIEAPQLQERQTPEPSDESLARRAPQFAITRRPLIRRSVRGHRVWHPQP